MPRLVRTVADKQSQQKRQSPNGVFLGEGDSGNMFRKRRGVQKCTSKEERSAKMHVRGFSHDVFGAANFLAYFTVTCSDILVRIGTFEVPFGSRDGLGGNCSPSRPRVSDLGRVAKRPERLCDRFAPITAPTAADKHILASAKDMGSFW